jgi:recombination protein RecR
VRNIIPRALANLINELGNLPGVGTHTAERYAYFLLKSSQNTIDSLKDAIGAIKTEVKSCPVTFALIDQNEEISPLYSDTNRNKKLIALVEEPLDIVPIERTGKFNGTYHVLGGVLSPIDGVGPNDLHITELIQRLKDDQVEELIIATNASVEGESTALYVEKQIKEAGVKLTISRLARGIPVGVDLEYTDQITLGQALEGRKVIND